MRPLEDAIVRLLKHRPFYGQLLLQFRRQKYSGSKAVAVTIADAIPTLMVDPEHLAVFNQLEQEALLEHLIKHILHLHPSRRKERYSRLWDLASDLAINPGIENLPSEAVYPQRFRLPSGLAAEEYYAKLLLLPELGNQDGSGHGSRSDQHRPEQSASGSATENTTKKTDTVDDHHFWNTADRTPQSLSEQVVRQMVQTAWKRSQGEVPGELQELIQQFLAPANIPWQQVLRQFIGTAGRIGKTGTWKRPHRRFGHNTPGLRKQQFLNLVVGIDVSDSTDTQPLREAFARELLQISRGRQSRITVLYAGSRIQKIAHFSGQPQISEVYRGGGYTDLRPIFAHVQKMNPRPAAVIYLTDGYGPAPEQSDIPTLWVLSPDGQKPVDWGLELRLEMLKENR
ncbi:MAG: VWA-like domain-containing protein [Deltaproteobacteria bacterium]|nr:VWA-like domain-containing protein [Deltaproteobacteria bacterium]MCW8892927.1 VWA-like domain-containing protein [Deltaproteobacteria bacterium]